MQTDIAARVRQIITEHLVVDESKVTPEASLTMDLGADSLDTTKLVMICEEEFDCEFSDEEAERVLLVQDAINLIERKIA